MARYRVKPFGTRSASAVTDGDPQAPNPGGLTVPRNAVLVVPTTVPEDGREMIAQKVAEALNALEAA